MTDEDVARLREQYLDAGRREPHQVVTLTDEEIVAIDGVETVAPRFWYDAQPEPARATAVAVAARGLVARGWAAADPTATTVDDLALQAVGPLLAVLALRREARLVLLAEQQLEGERRARVYYLLPAAMALEEAVNSAGLHRFTAMTTRHGIDSLAQWCDPFETPSPAQPREHAVDATTDLTTLSATVLGDTRVVSVIASVSGRADTRRELYLSVYAGADRLTTGSRDGTVLRLRDVGRPELADILTEMVE